MAKRLIRIAHSPDSDDAYMFWALKHGRVTSPDFDFQIERRDIEELNRAALNETFDITAISFHAYAHLCDRYALLASGSSFAEKDYGPMIVAKSPLLCPPRGFPSGHKEGLGEVDPVKIRVAIPGEWTTAALILRMMMPHVETVVIPFEKIMPAVLDGSIDAGLIIHEGQLQYEKSGLVCAGRLIDFWQDLCAQNNKPTLPLPLGGNAIKKSLGAETIAELSNLMRESILCARANHSEARDYARQFKRDLSNQEADLYLSWYANDRTLDMGQDGTAALSLLFDAALTRGLLKQSIKLEIV